MSHKCSDCGKEFDSERGLHIHQAQMHNESEEENKEINTDTNPDPNSETVDISLELKQLAGLAFTAGTLFGIVIGLSSAIFLGGFSIDPGNDSPSADNSNLETLSAVPYDVNFGIGEENLETENESIALEGRPYMGDEDAPVTMVSYEDFFCPYCTGFHNEEFASANGMYSAFGSIVENHIETGEVKYYFKNFPVVGGERPAEVAECVLDNGDSEAYWTFHYNHFQHFEGLRQLQQQNADRYDDIMLSWSDQLGLDQEFESCVENPDKTTLLQNHTREAQNLGASATPTNIINGEVVEGAQPYSAFQTVIEDKLN